MHRAKVRDQARCSCMNELASMWIDMLCRLPEAWPGAHRALARGNAALIHFGQADSRAMGGLVLLLACLEQSTPLRLVSSHHGSACSCCRAACIVTLPAASGSSIPLLVTPYLATISTSSFNLRRDSVLLKPPRLSRPQSVRLPIPSRLIEAICLYIAKFRDLTAPRSRHTPSIHSST